MGKSVHMITFQGRTLSLREWAKKYNMNYCTLYFRLFKLKMNFKDALFTPLRGGKRLEIGGKYFTVRELARVMKVVPDTIYQRRRKGWKNDELTAPLRKTMTLTAFGKTQTVTEWTRETGIKKGTIQSRLRDGWSVEDALSIKPLPYGVRRCDKGLTAFGETKPVNWWAREYGISPNTIKKRLQSGLSPEKAIKLPTGKSKKEAA